MGCGLVHASYSLPEWHPSLNSEHLEFVPTVPQSFYLTVFKLDPSNK